MKRSKKIQLLLVTAVLASCNRVIIPGETAAAYDFWRAGSGRNQVPGIIKCFGARPDFLRQVVEFSNKVHFSEGHLSRRHKEMIASYVSYLNRCPY